MTAILIPNLFYRIFRLRRLLGLIAALHCLGLMAALSLALPGTEPPLWYTAGGGFALSAYLSLRFPHGWIETSLLAAVTSALLAILPLGLDGGAAMNPPQAVGLALLAMMAWMGLVWLVCTYAPGLGLRERRHRYHGVFPVSARALRKALFLKPSVTDAQRTTGQANAEGFFTVSIPVTSPEFTPAQEGILETIEEGYLARILECGPTHQVTQSCMPRDSGSDGSSVVRETIEDLGMGCTYDLDEVHDLHDTLTALGFWLNDAQGDYLSAQVDALLGLPERALKLAPFDTPMSVLAGWFGPMTEPGKDR